MNVNRRETLNILASLAGTSLFAMSAASNVHAEETTTRRILISSNADLYRFQQQALSSKTLSLQLPTEQQTVLLIQAGEYILEDTLRISRSNFVLLAEPGTKLTLAPGVNKPVLAIGSQKENPGENDVIENIAVFNVTIDGNKDHQDSEFDAKLPWIRNNGIDVRAVKGLTIDNVTSKNNRSGGIVISWGSSDIHIVHCRFDENFFDGAAYYASQRIYTAQCSMKNNRNAGISLDNDLTDCLFTDCILDSNGDVGIFARFSKQLRFNGCSIFNSGNWAAFMSHDENNHGVHDVILSTSHLLNNNGGLFMGSINEVQSSFNSVVGCVFRGNEKDGRKNINSAGSKIWESGNVMMG